MRALECKLLPGQSIPQHPSLTNQVGKAGSCGQRALGKCVQLLAVGRQALKSWRQADGEEGRREGQYGCTFFTVTPSSPSTCAQFPCIPALVLPLASLPGAFYPFHPNCQCPYSVSISGPLGDNRGLWLVFCLQCHPCQSLLSILEPRSF